jgi:hypothetical protein
VAAQAPVYRHHLSGDTLSDVAAGEAGGERTQCLPIEVTAVTPIGNLRISRSL